MNLCTETVIFLLILISHLNLSNVLTEKAAITQALLLYGSVSRHVYVLFHSVQSVTTSVTTTLSSILQMGQFYYSAKAFDVLERLDPSPEYWDGKRGACVGIFQMILAGREPK